jgi:tetratricopeptide (TPR) repeat protein
MTRSALLIATNEYRDQELNGLESPAGDAQELAKLLADPAIGRFELEPILIDEEAYTLQQRLEDFFADRQHDDLLFLYLSCHGVKDTPGRLYFASTNTRRDRLATTTVPADWLADRMMESQSRQIVTVLDCCHSGAIARYGATKADRRVGVMDQLHVHEQAEQGRGCVVLTATDSIGYAWEEGGVSQVGEVRSIFTAALIEGLRTGDADLDGDRRISVSELYDYAYKKVCSETPNQRPGKWIPKPQQGALVVAWHHSRAAGVPNQGDLQSHVAARALEPNTPDATRVYFQQLDERVDRAFASYVADEPPGRSHWAVKLAEALKARSDNAGAEKAYRAALHAAATRTEVADAGAGLGQLLKLGGRHQEAAEAYRDVIAAGETPHLKPAWLALAETLEALGRADEVVRTYRQAAAAGVDEAWLRLGRYFTRNGAHENAAEAYHEATGVGEVGQRRAAWLALAGVSKTLDNHGDVVLGYTRAAELGEHKAWLKLGEYLTQRGALHEAAEAYRRGSLASDRTWLPYGRHRTARKARKALESLGADQLAS